MEIARILLIGLFVTGLLLSATLDLLIRAQINKQLPESQHWSWWRGRSFIGRIQMMEAHKKFHPTSHLRECYWTAIGLTIAAVVILFFLRGAAQR